MMAFSTGRKLHILIVPSWYKTPLTPVQGTFFDEQARAIQSEGHTVGIIYPEYVPPTDKISLRIDHPYDFYVDNGIPTFYLKSSSGIPKLKKLSLHRFNLDVESVFEDYISNFGIPDIIHAHSIFHAGVCASFIAKKHGIPFVITEHLSSFLVDYNNSKSDLEMSKKIFLKADAALIVSNNFRIDMERKLDLPDGTFRVVHNLVSDIFLQGFVQKKWDHTAPFELFTNSFLLPRKNVSLIIEAVKILKDRGKNIRLSIGGDGPEEQKLKSLVKNLGLEATVSFKGKLFRNEVKQAIDDCHCFVLASKYETFGVVLIESLACGRPVVITDSGGPKDFITPEQGVIIGKHDASEMADAIEYVMNNYDSYDQQKIVDYCREKFEKKKITGEILSVYRKVLSARLGRWCS